tara:strand:+ start:3846 stop:4571 length:726 start_codon:yes stop_codon:yes gene_type:complete
MKIIGIAGRKQSGKNTVANYINGSILQSLDMISDFEIGNNGELEIKTKDSSGTDGWGVFDVTRKDEEFISYAENSLFPYVKVYHFADPLKLMAIDFFDLEPQQVYGTDKDKNTSTPYTQNGWKHKMTSREFLQYFGTEVMRKIKDTVWVDYTIKKIQQEQSSVAIIPDVRFPNEVDAIKKAGGVVIRLDRNIYDDQHVCETALDKDKYDWDNFDYIINNNDSSLSDLCKSLGKLKHFWSNL